MRRPEISPVIQTSEKPDSSFSRIRRVSSETVSGPLKDKSSCIDNRYLFGKKVTPKTFKLFLKFRFSLCYFLFSKRK